MKKIIFVFLSVIISLNMVAVEADCNSSECIKFVSYSDNFFNESNAIYCSDNCEVIESNKEFILYVNRNIESFVDMQEMLHEMVKNVMKEDGLFFSRFKGQTLKLNNFSIYFKNNTDTPLFKGNIILQINDFASPSIEISSDILSVKYEYYFQKKTSQKTFVGKYELRIPEKGWTINQIFKDYDFPDQFSFNADKFKITGKIESFIFMEDLEGYYLRLSNADILNIDDFMRSRFSSAILKEMDIPIERHGVRKVSFNLNIFNEVVEFENINIDSNMFQLSGGRIVIEDGEITEGILPVVPEKPSASKFFKFLHDKIAKFKGFTINLSGDYIQPEILFDARDSILEFFSRRLSEKPLKPDESEDYSKSTYNSYVNFKKEFDAYFDSENQDLSTISFASLILLLEDKTVWEKLSSFKIKDEWMMNELNFLSNKIDLFSTRQLNSINSVVLSRVSIRFYNKYYENNKNKYLELSKMNNWPQFDKEFNLYEYISDLNAGIEDFIDIEDMKKEFLKIDMGADVGELPIESAVMLVAVPQAIEGTGKIAYKIEKKILKNAGIEVANVLKNFAIRQTPFLTGSGTLIKEAAPVLKRIHGPYHSGHKTMSRFLFGESMNHIHTAMDIGGGGYFHRAFNHDIPTIFRMGRKFGLRGSLAATQHLFQDFFTTHGLPIFPPEFIAKISGKSLIKDAKQIQIISKVFSINSVKFMNGVMVAVLGYDLANTALQLEKIYQKYGGKYLLTRNIRISLEKGIPLITKPSSNLLLRLLGKRVSVITLSGVLNAVLYGWFAYDIYEYYKSSVFINEISEPEKRYAEVHYLFGNHVASLKHSRRFFQEKNQEYMFHLNTCSSLMLSDSDYEKKRLSDCVEDIKFLIDNDNSPGNKPSEIKVGQTTFIKKAFLYDLISRIQFELFRNDECEAKELNEVLNAYKKYINEIDLSQDAVKKGWFDSEKENLNDLNKKTRAVVDYLVLVSAVISQNKDHKEFPIQKSDLIGTINNLHKYIMSVDEHFKNRNSTEEAKKAIAALEEFRVFREKFLQLQKN